MVKNQTSRVRMGDEPQVYAYILLITFWGSVVSLIMFNIKKIKYADYD